MVANSQEMTSRFVGMRLEETIRASLLSPFMHADSHLADLPQRSPHLDARARTPAMAASAYEALAFSARGQYTRLLQQI